MNKPKTATQVMIEEREKMQKSEKITVTEAVYNAVKVEKMTYREVAKLFAFKSTNTVAYHIKKHQDEMGIIDKRLTITERIERMETAMEEICFMLGINF